MSENKGMTSMPPQARQQSPIACDLTALDTMQRARHQELVQRILPAIVEEIQDLPDGYAFRCAADHYALVTEFVEYERRCCPFLTFMLTVERERGPLWLRITGDAEVKRFLRAELGLER